VTPAVRRLAAAAIAGAALLTGCAAGRTEARPLLIERQGAFAVGGRVAGDEAASSLHCDHGVAEYQIPPRPRAVNLLLWHSASAGAWQNRWDGGEGFQSLFVRRGFPVYIWDGPRVGRANWACVPLSAPAQLGQDQQNFVAWRFGPEYRHWFDGVQFPRDDAEAFNQAMRGRYQEFDALPNVELESAAAARLADRIGPTVAVTNSAGGLRGLMAALQSGNIVGVVAYEDVGAVFPNGEGPGGPPGPFGPVEVPLEDFMKLTRIPIQLVWGDHVEDSARFKGALAQSRLFVEVINRHGGKAQILMLRDAGLKGNTHLPFADMNNVAVADLLSAFLKANGLDARARPTH
jgi:hypothetical protein